MFLLLLLHSWLADQLDFDSAYRAGLTALVEHRLTDARLNLESAAKLQPKNPTVWIALAETYWKSNDRAAAGSAAAKAGSLAPANPVVLHGLALFYQSAELWDRAADSEARYAALADDRQAPLRAAGFYLKAGKPDEAAVQFEAAIRLNPADESLYFELSKLHLERQKFEQAAEVLAKGRKIFDKSPQLELAYGVALYGLRRFPEAADAFLRTIRLAPDVEQPYLFLSRFLEMSEDRLPAITAAFRALMERNPESFFATLLYAKALSAGGAAPDEVEPLLRKSIAGKADYWESHFELALVLERRRQFADAAAEMRRAIEFNPKNPVPHYRIARLLDRLGKPEEAKTERELHERLAAEEKRQPRGMEVREPVIQ